VIFTWKYADKLEASPYVTKLSKEYPPRQPTDLTYLTPLKTDFFEKVPNLTHLRLENAKLFQWSGKLFPWKNLHKLTLINTPTFDDEMCTNLINLTELEIPYVIKYVSMEQKESREEFYGHGFRYLKSLTHLHVDGRRYIRAKNFAYLKKLKVLNLVWIFPTCTPEPGMAG
jgi:hypothetical protein